MLSRNGGARLFRRPGNRGAALLEFRRVVRPDGRRSGAAGHRGHRKHHRRQPAAQPRAPATEPRPDHRRTETPHLARLGGPPRADARRHRRSPLAPDRPDAVRRFPENPPRHEDRRKGRHRRQRARNRRGTPRRHGGHLRRRRSPSLRTRTTSLPASSLARIPAAPAICSSTAWWQA